jgi:hypothetical protein
MGIEVLRTNTATNHNRMIKFNVQYELISHCWQGQLCNIQSLKKLVEQQDFAIP